MEQYNFGSNQTKDYLVGRPTNHILGPSVSYYRIIFRVNREYLNELKHRILQKRRELIQNLLQILNTLTYRQKKFFAKITGTFIVGTFIVIVSALDPLILT